jgi:branched-chain amino acid transport system permease protein
MEETIVILVRGIGAGAVYALIAMSLNVIYNATGVLNFAQGQLLILSGVMTHLLLPAGIVATSLMWYPVGLLVTLVVAAIAALQGLLTLLAMRRGSSDQHSWIITTLSASIVIGAVLVLALGPRTLLVEDPFGSFDLLGTTTPLVYLALIALAIVVLAVTQLFQRKSLVGLALNALSQDLDAAKANGMRTLRLQVLAFAIGGAIMGLTGFVGGFMLAISVTQALHYVIFGFVAAVVGGLGNNLGALIAGPVFGVLMMFSSFYVSGAVQVPLALAALVIVLMARPQGIFGRPHARRV